VIALPGLAATVAAAIGLANGPSDGRHAVPAHAQARAAVRAALRAGVPAPLAAGPPRELGVPKRLAGSGPFLTVRGRAARLSTAPRRRGVVALTFDDGPGPLTPAFLRRLERLHAKATFFVIGYAVNARPRILRRELRLGMGIGNHSWNHPPMRSLRAVDQRFQIAADEDAIERVVGYRPLFFRPPDLSFNLVTAREIAAAGMVGALYTVDTRDWSRPGVRGIVRRALQVRPGGVIAMHDAGGDRRETLAALGPIVRGLRKRHMEPVTLDELYRPAGRRGIGP